MWSDCRKHVIACRRRVDARWKQLATAADEHQAGVTLQRAPVGPDVAEGDEHGAPKYLGNHGQRGSYPDNHALFVAAGPAIRRGVQLPVVRSRDVAPTVAATLGVRFGAIEGVALDAALG